jgi:hypothetical protein
VWFRANFMLSSAEDTSSMSERCKILAQINREKSRMTPTVFVYNGVYSASVSMK